MISGGYATVIIIIGGILLIELLLIVHRARQVVRHKRKTDKQEADLSGQLVQAAKLATVGELAAGIAHEINNPLAIIAEETGLVRDLMDPVLVMLFQTRNSETTSISFMTPPFAPGTLLENCWDSSVRKK